MMQQVIHYKGEHSPIDNNPITRSELMQLMLTSGRKEASIDRTTLWQYSVERNTDMSLLFFHSPPVLEAVKADRLLFVGTKADIVSELSDLYRAISASQPSTKLNTCSMTSNFWASFFDRDAFLDNQDQCTIPKGIISTGRIRNEFLGSNETLNVADRLKQIATSWGIPLKLI